MTPIPIVNAAAEIVKANTTALYQDAAQPSVRVVGKSLAQCTSLFVTPIGRMAEIFEKNIQKYLDRLEGLKEDQLVSPDTRILVPVLEKMRFTSEEKVAEYYAEILATASKKETASKVMVTFIEILNRLSADEIKILEFINSPNNFVTVEDFTENEISTYDLPKDVKKLALMGSLPVVDVNLHTTGKTGYVTLVRNFNYIREKISLDYPSNLEPYLDNMISLGLLEREFSRTFAIGKIYDCLEKHIGVEKMKKNIGTNQRIEFERGRLDVTNLGKKLLILCSPKKE
jgi:hypothetical protein